MAATAISTLLCAGVFLYQHSALLGQRKLLDLWSYPVLASRPGLANSVAYWVVLLVLDFGLAYILSLAWVIWNRDPDLLENKVLDCALLDRALRSFCLRPKRSQRDREQ
jgi:hypothetical protein